MSLFSNFVAGLFKVVKADDEELVDPQKVLREKCAGQDKCAKLQNILTECNDRVNSRTKTEENCMEELIDYVQCVDHCVAKDLFKKLK